MKLSLAWVFEHIQDIAWQHLDIDALVDRFNNTTAEIESCCRVSFDLPSCGLAYLTQQKGDQAVLYCPEWNSTFMLPHRKDTAVGSLCLIKKDHELYRYATIQDFAGTKEGLLPPLSCPAELVQGGWKDACLQEDYLITLDNTSLTHRPDLWSHRGIAREIAALLGVHMVPEEELIVQKIIKNYGYRAPIADSRFTLEIDDPGVCDRFAGIFISTIENKHSVPFVAQCLASIDARPINALVDATNYVMYDIGQPMHAFDASALTGELLHVTTLPGKRLELLDGQVITLSPTDSVVAQGDQPLALAGIMGGTAASISMATVSTLVESAHFQPAALRKSSLAHKKRTESSARFEKWLDPNQNTTALMRFLRLLNDWGIAYTVNQELVSLGEPACPRTIILEHDFVTQKVGIDIPSQDIMRILTALEFGIAEDEKAYVVTVPTFRLRDITIQDDLVEEIVRFVGYGTLEREVPRRVCIPIDNHQVFCVRRLKRYCAFGLKMHEIASYPLYDEQFLRLLDWEPEGSPGVSNPVSEHWCRLVTSLVPHLLHAIAVNSNQKQALRFFEWARVWHQQEQRIDERYCLAAAWYDPSQAVDFYASKADLVGLFDMLGISVMWQKAAVVPAPWYHPYQTAQLYHGETSIGYAGMISPLVLDKIAPGSAFIAELDGTFLREYVKPPVFIKPLPKYPSTHLDVSVLAPFDITCAQLERAIMMSDHRIRDVYLADYYEKNEWHEQRSLTLRFKVSDETKTLTKEDIDNVLHAVHGSLQKLGVAIR